MVWMKRDEIIYLLFIQFGDKCSSSCGCKVKREKTYVDFIIYTTGN
jgi:hypothetical protein